MTVETKETIVLKSIGERYLYAYTKRTVDEEMHIKRGEQQAVMLVGAVLGAAIVKMKEGDIVTVDIQFERKGVYND